MLLLAFLPVILAAPIQPGSTFVNIGQNYLTEWQGFSRIKTPAGISVYGDIYSGLNSDSVELLEAYAAEHSGYVEVGLSWKDAMTSQGYTQFEGAKLCNDIAEGKYDTQLKRLSNYLAGFSVKYLFRVDYEVSGNLHANTAAGAFDPSTFDLTAYPKAFAHVRSVVGTKNIQYVFHAVRGSAEDLYPGDDVVDFIGISLFNNDVCLTVGNTPNCPGETVDPNVNKDLSWAPKPILIAESAPQPGGDFIEFLERVTDIISKYNVAGWTYINSDWTAHGWPADVWGDTRIDANPEAQVWFEENVVNNPRYTWG